MSGIDFLADTNAVLYFLSGNECMKPYISCKYAVSIISEMELLSYPKITEEEEKNVNRFLVGSTLLSITNEVKKKTIELRKKYNIKLPDAIIAATAMENDLTLITADKGFEKVEELKLTLIVPEINAESDKQ